MIEDLCLKQADDLTWRRLIRDSRRLYQANRSGARIRVGRGLPRATCMHGPPGLRGHGR